MNATHGTLGARQRTYEAIQNAARIALGSRKWIKGCSGIKCRLHLRRRKRPQAHTQNSCTILWSDYHPPNITGDHIALLVIVRR